MKEIKVSDILDIKYAEKNFPQVLKNPYFLDKIVSFVGENLDKYDGVEYKTFIYQIDGTNQGISIQCEINDDNKNLLNGYDFPFLTKKQKSIEEMYYNTNLSHYRGAKPCYDYVERLSRKYGLDEELIKNCGNIEPIYKKLTENQIILEPLAEFFMKNINGCETTLLNSLTEEEKNSYYFNLCDLNCGGYILSKTIFELSEQESVMATKWIIGQNKNIKADRLYVVSHIYDTDGGFGDAISQKDILFTTLDKDMAEAYVNKYSKPVIYDRPYNDLYHGELEITSIPFIHTMDISKAGPEIFGGVNTIGENDIKENDISYLEEEL